MSMPEGLKKKATELAAEIAACADYEWKWRRPDHARALLDMGLTITRAVAEYDQWNAGAPPAAD